MAHLAQERYSALVDAKLRASIVQKDGVIWNNRYEGNPKAGAVKIPIRDTEVAVGNYSKTAGATQTSGSTAYLTVNINKDKAVNEVIDGFDVESVPDNLVADRLDSAGYSMGLQVNDDGTTELVTGGSYVNTSSALTKSNIYEKFVDVRTSMSTAKIPTTGRWALVNPLTTALILKSPEFISASNLGDAVKQLGALGQIAGFTLYEDNTLPANVSFICGHMDWCTRVREWAVPVHLQSLDGSGAFIGATAVQGRSIYTHKVTKPVAVQIVSKVLDPTIAEATASSTTTITLTAGANATKVMYRKGTVTSGVTTWGTWTEYSATSKPTASATDIIEAYGVDGDDIKSGTVSHTVTAE